MDDAVAEAAESASEVNTVSGKAMGVLAVYHNAMILNHPTSHGWSILATGMLMLFINNMYRYISI